ncbi:BMC domain-containing protein [Bacillaceae bacterium IKA-2]|nr:BMC domain-containing protein [Bacillaceae bacterium IKA-2]
MRKFDAIGMIEVQYYTVAVEILDHISKSTKVEFLTSENYLGGRLVTLVVGGGISDITEAIEIARKVCQHKRDNPLKMALVITNPHPEILKYMIPSRTQDLVIEESVNEESIIDTSVEANWVDDVVQTHKRKPKLNRTKTKGDLS